MDTVKKTEKLMGKDLVSRIKGSGSASTMRMTVSESRRGLERTLSRTSTRAGTSAKVAVRKIGKVRIRGLKVLAHMHTDKWNTMGRPVRE